MTQEKEEKLWQAFTGSGNSGAELVEKAKALAPVLLFFVTNAKDAFFASLKEGKGATLNKEKEFEVSNELLFFIVHLVDRVSFLYFGSKKRKIFSSTLVFELASVISWPEADATQKEEFGSLFRERFSNSQIEYGKYAMSFPEGGEDLNGTLFWEFGKKIASICGYGHDPEVIGYAGGIAVSCIAVLQVEELLKGDIKESKEQVSDAFKWADKDYYTTLGIDRSASQKEIRKAYLRKAKEHHPDKNMGLKNSESFFKEAAEAFEVLGDAKKRCLYDRAREFLFSQTHFDSDTVIPCPNCRQRLRIPDGQSLTITCPECRTSFDHTPITETYKSPHPAESKHQESKETVTPNYVYSHEAPMPVLLSIIGALAIFFGSCQVFLFILSSGSSNVDTTVRIGSSSEALFLAAGIVMWVYVFKRRIWARTGLIIIYSLSIFGGFVLATEGNQKEQSEGIAAIIVGSLLIAYLFTKGVKAYFGLSERKEASYKPEATTHYEPQRPKETAEETTTHKPVQPVSRRSSSRKRSLVFTILGLVFIFPMGLNSMWSEKHFPLWARITISACIGVTLLTGMIILNQAVWIPSSQTAYNLQQPIKREPDTSFYSAKTPPLTQDEQKSFMSKGNLTAAQISSKYGTAVVSIINQGRHGTISGIGSGFVIDEKGIIATNHHCVEGGYTLSVKFLTEDFPRTAKVIATDKDSDIAILKIDKPAPVAVTLGNSDTIIIGEEIVVIGTPQGLEYTVSDGIISSIRERGMLQLSAPISKGSSGSPVFNMQGQVIGIVFMYMETGQNLNFAIPINKMKELLPAQTVVAEPPVEIVEEAETVFNELPQLNLPVDGKVYALRKSKEFHRPNCDTIQGVSRTELFPFSSKSDAEAYGATPCNLCFKNTAFKKLPEPAIEAKAAPQKKEGFITIGSSKADVIEVLGAPDRMNVYSSTEYWYYGYSKITFKYGRVHEYDQSSFGEDLKIRLKPEHFK